MHDILRMYLFVRRAQLQVLGMPSEKPTHTKCTRVSLGHIVEHQAYDRMKYSIMRKSLVARVEEKRCEKRRSMKNASTTRVTSKKDIDAILN
jgi:hypothetical protein